MQIESFDGEYRFLSNFYPVWVTLDGVSYPSVENAYQAAKFHPLHREDFKGCTAGQAKRYGKRPGKRMEWEAVKVDVMHRLLIQKFKQPHLRKLLLDTGDAVLIESNTWGDTFWGVCKGVGDNRLGRLLMAVRDGNSI